MADKVKLITLHKPDGKEMQVNETSLPAALKMGWTKTKPKKK